MKTSVPKIWIHSDYYAVKLDRVFDSINDDLDDIDARLARLLDKSS